MRRLFCIIIFAFAFYAPMSHGAIRNYVLTNWDGLSNANPTSFYQDPTGLLWIGTWDGLNVYDGRSFRIFKHDPDNPNSLSDNVVWKITSQGSDRIWVATDYGVNMLDYYRNKISRFYLGFDKILPSERKAFSVAATDNTVFASASGSGVAYYDEKDSTMKLFNAPGVNLINVKDIHCIGDNILLVVLNDGKAYELSYRSDDDGIIIDLAASLLEGESILSSFEQKDDVYLLSDKYKLFRINKSTAELTELGDLPEKNDVSSVVGLPDSSVLVSFKSFNVYMMKDGKSSRFEQLDGRNVSSMYFGSQNILWAAIDDKGIEAIYNDEVNIERLLNKDLFKGRSGQVSKIVEDEYGNIYVATQGNGIFRIGKDGGIKIINTDSGLRSNRITGLAVSPYRKILAGGEAGIDIIDIDDLSIRRLNCASGNDKLAYSILIGKDNSLWVGTFGNGLFKFIIEKKGQDFFVSSETHYLHDASDSLSVNNNTIMSLVPEGEDRLWVGTLGGGLDLLGPDGKFDHFIHEKDFNSLSSNNVLCLLRMSSDSSLIIGTTNGLNILRFDPANGPDFTLYNLDNGLKDNTIHGILNDGAGVLWLSTNQGLSSIDLRTGSVINFSDKVYLQNMEFSNGSCLRASDGKMYFGGVDGINYFYPDEVQFSNYEPSIHFDRFMVRQDQVDDFMSRDPVRLKHNENFFSVSFSAIDFINNGDCEYSYILEGFDNEWVQNGTSHTAVFTNVPPGKYLLKVICTKGDRSGGSLSPATLKIIINHPWWDTFWAYCAYAIGIFLVIFFIIRFIEDRREKTRLREQAENERKHKEETYEAKLRFFTNITHEFGTPLTLITSAGEQMSDMVNLPSKAMRYVGIIKDSANRMRRLISELLEFRKVETGNYIPEYSRFDINAMLDRIAGDFYEIQEDQGIDLKLDTPKEPLYIVSDQNAIEKIIFNLLSNAFKYTSLNGSILVSLSDDGSTHLSVRNTGQGIAPEKIDSVFDRFVILDKFEKQAKKGQFSRNGIGLALTKNLVEVLSGEISVESTVGQYTEFKVNLPHIDPNKVELHDNVQNIHQEVLPEPNVSDKEETETYNAAGSSVMIVDDDAQIRDLVAEILGHDYKVIPAVDGQDALEKLKHERPDLIITDLSMPEMDGIELIKNLKSNDFTKYIPVSILTMDSDEESQVRGYELGIDAFITKPFSPKHLKAVVKSIFSNQELMKKYYNSSISNKDVYEEKVVDSSDKEFIVRLTGVVEKHIDDGDLSPEFLASEMAVSKMQLYRKLKAITGDSPTVFVRNLRLEKASHLLKTTNLTVLEIMYQCGFNNRAYFHREFTKKFGTSPKVFQKMSQIEK